MNALFRLLMGVKFVIKIEGGLVARVKGEAPEEYLKDVERICELWGIETGIIKGVGRGERIEVEVGGGIDKQHAMAFKNAWRNPL
ncbi:DUF3634 family protein [Planctomycetota bacterium]|nr:DUF3634 family protein [Planctomycetota bacterium]